MPDIIQFKNGNQIKNTYDASGRKLGTEYFTQQSLIDPLSDGQILNQSYIPGVVSQKGTVYIDNKEYNTLNGNPALTILKRVYNAEGYTEDVTFPIPNYYYYRRDHLGNNREVWCANTNATVQRTQYYPSGLPWTYNAGDNPLGSQERKFNGKEFVEMHGYDTYDYGARGYYPAIGRFMSVDPLAEKYYSISPYAYCAGNPVKYIDPNGMDWFQNNQTGAVVYVSNLHQGAEKGMEKGWQWMGKNDMFKSDKNDIANSDQTLALKNGGNFKVIGNNPLTHNDDQVVVSMSLEGDKATKFMSDRGFDFKPTQQIRLESEIDIHLESGATAVTGEKTYITEKSVYVPHGSIEDGYTPLNDAKFGPISSVNRFQISYTDNIIKKGLNSLMPYIGYHDQRIPVVYPSLNSYPGNNELINIFLKTAKR